MTRSEFSSKTKVEAFELAKGRCQICTANLSIGNVEYDHIIPCALDIGGGDNGLGNCRAICKACHRRKTSRDDVPRIAKAKRNFRMAAGVRRKRAFTIWRRFSGELVRVSRER